MLSMHKHVYSKATYTLRVNQFTRQQVGKGDKRNEFSLNTKSMLSMHKRVYSKATYGLRVYQFTTQQVVKGGTGPLAAILDQYSHCRRQCIELCSADVTAQSVEKLVTADYAEGDRAQSEGQQRPQAL